MNVQHPGSASFRPILNLLFWIGLSVSATSTATGATCATGHAAAATVSTTATDGYDCADPDTSCTAFATLQDAVLDAVSRFNPCSINSDTEYLGAILYKNGPQPAYIYTIGTGVHGEDNIRVRVRIPVGYKAVGFWHTHGRERTSHRLFSATDTALAEQYQLPLYLANYTGRVRVYEPGSPTISRQEARRLGLGNRSGYSRGAPVFDRIHY